MKKLYIILVLLCTGCGSSTSEVNENWNTSANYQVLRNSMSIMRNMDVNEHSILVFPQATGTINMTEVYLPAYIQDEQVILMDANPSSSCSLENPSACDYTISVDKTPYYYQGKLYYIGQAYDGSTDQYVEAIYQSELDGSNQKNIYTFEEKSNSNGWTSSFLQFHQGNMYAYHQEQLYIGNLTNNTFEKLSLSSLSGIYSLFFVDDIMYVCAETYDDGKDVHFDVVVACDLQGTFQELVYEDYGTYYIDEKVMFYLNEDENCTYMYLRQEDQHIKVLDGPCAYFFSYNGQYVVDGIGFDDQQLIVVDTSGTIVKRYSFTDDEFHYPQVFTGDKLYVSKNGWYGYYELDEDEIIYHELQRGDAS